MNKVKTIAAIGLAIAAISSLPIYYPSTAFAESYVGAGVQGEEVYLDIAQLNADQQTDARVKADNVTIVLKQVSPRSKAQVLVVADDVDALVIAGKCPPGKVAKAIVGNSGPVVPRCY